MASVFRDQGLIEDARSTIERAIAHNPQSFKLLFEALTYYDEQQQIEKLQAFFSTTMQQVENKEDFYRYFVLFCCENELYDYAIEVLEQHQADPAITYTVAYYLAAFYFLSQKISKGCEYLSNALLIDYEGHKDFLSIDPILSTFSEVDELIELYKP